MLVREGAVDVARRADLAIRSKRHINVAVCLRDVACQRRALFKVLNRRKTGFGKRVCTVRTAQVAVPAVRTPSLVLFHYTGLYSNFVDAVAEERRTSNLV